MRKEAIRETLERNEIPFTGELPEQLAIYLALLGEWNRKMDLTAEASEEEWLDRHLIDSLTVLKTDLFPTGGCAIDVGTGAGFPGLVLAMACPDCRMTLLDAQQKRLNFLQAVVEAIGLKNTALRHARAEDGARTKDLREQFDAVLARAVAPLNVLCEYLLPYARIGGYALCWKGPSLREELEGGRKAAFLLGGRVGEVFSCPVVGRDWDHLILSIHKERKTPGIYPRKAGTPAAQPLGT